MKYLLMFFISSLCWADGAIELKSFPNNTCFDFTYVHRAEHKWEITKIEKTLPWVLLDKDDTAVYIAQPSAYCEENDIKSCPFYWLRTVEYKDNWMSINGQAKKTTCPKGIFNKLKGRQR